MDCHAGFDSRWGRCKNQASRPSQGTVNGGAVSKWPRCRWDAIKTQPTNQPTSQWLTWLSLLFEILQYIYTYWHFLSLNVFILKHIIFLIIRDYEIAFCAFIFYICCFTIIALCIIEHFLKLYLCLERVVSLETDLKLSNERPRTH